MIAEIILGSVSAALVAALVLLYRSQRRAIALVTSEREEIDQEEHRMFAFLHGLGIALAKDESPARMYEIIVTGVADVMEARGGALYLADTSQNCLVPTHISRGCPPLIPLPGDVVKAAQKSPHAVGSYLRLATVPTGDGLLGAAFSSRTSRRIADLGADNGFQGYDSPLHAGVAVLVAPLTHGDKRLGVLAVASEPGAPVFTNHDFDLFKSVAEQSAFALGNALVHQQAADKKRIEDELKAASEIQRILLPSSFPELQDYRVSGENYPAKIVSGDYYDFIEIDRDHYGVVIADVSGKGIPASLIMAMCRSVLRAHAPGNHSPAQVLSAVNRLIFTDIREDMFISMAYLILDRTSDQIVIARAGHDPPMHYIHSEDRVEFIKPPGLALGIDPGSVFDRVTCDYTFQMAPGDALLLYTDGTNEALDSQGMEFCLDRLQDTFAAAAGHGADAVISAIVTEIRGFVGESRQSDDITLIAVEKR
ncbi:hypothetical protein BH23VER1_BH23VER1_06840 [soil metagenome]